MKSEEERALAAKQRSAVVKNAKEYMASERELQAHAQERAGARRKRSPSWSKRSPTAKKSIEQHEADFAALKEHVGGEAKAANEKLAEFDAQIAEERKLRDVAAGARAARRAQEVHDDPHASRAGDGRRCSNGTCQGCNMNIPPQLYNILQRGDAIELCPNCNRIIYWDKSAGEIPTARRPSRRTKPQLVVRAWYIQLGSSRSESDEVVAAGASRDEESPGSIGQGAG